MPKQAETITLTVTIRPSYGSVASVRREVVDSLEWLTSDHDAARLTWGPVGTVETDEWDEDEEEDE